MMLSEDESCRDHGPGPLLAIVIIGYNEGHTLERCLLSVLKAAKAFQTATGSAPSILFVDSHSTDKSVSIAQSLGVAVAQAPSRFKTCTNNRMTGFALTRSKYLMFLDGDMELREPWLAKGVEFLEARGDVAGVAGIRDDVRISPFGEPVVIQNYNRISLEVAPIDDDVGGAFLLRRTALEGIGGLEAALAPEEDYVMFCQLKARGWGLYRIKHPMMVHWDRKLSSVSQTVRHIVWHGRATVPGVILRHAVLHERWAACYLWHFKRKLIIHFLWLCSTAGVILYSCVVRAAPWWCVIAATGAMAAYCVQLWHEKRSIARVAFAFVLRPIYLLHLLIGFVFNRPEVEFGVQETKAYRREIAQLNPGLMGTTPGSTS
jgi:glycosyltransferase involved in cell wall biosynthesis